MTEVNLFESNVETSCFNGKKDLTINVFINGDFVSQIKDRKFTVAAKADGGIKVIVESGVISESAKNADLIMQYAKDAHVMMNPWVMYEERWVMTKIADGENGRFQYISIPELIFGEWTTCKSKPRFHWNELEIRRKSECDGGVE